MAKMKAEPNAELLIEWIDKRAEGPEESLAVDIRIAIESYRVGSWTWNR